MRQILSFLAVSTLLSLLATTAAAECYADYKAKQDNPLRLHYGVMEVPVCQPGPARQEIAKRLKKSGWTLLNVISVFGPEGLDQRKENAGKFYLRF